MSGRQPFHGRKGPPSACARVSARAVNGRRRWTPGPIPSVTGQKARALGLRDLPLHSLRHTTANLLLSAGVPAEQAEQAEQAARIMGHNTALAAAKEVVQQRGGRTTIQAHFSTIEVGAEWVWERGGEERSKEGGRTGSAQRWSVMVHASDRIGRLFRSMPAAHFGAAGRDRSPGAQAPGPRRGWRSGGRPTGPKRAADMAEMRNRPGGGARRSIRRVAPRAATLRERGRAPAV